MNTISGPLYEHAFPDWTVEDFDAIQEEHVFSDRYKRTKKNIIHMHRKKSFTAARFYKIAAAVAACIVLPVSVYAGVAHSDFFSNAFGDAGRQSNAAHEEIIEDGKGGQLTVTYPEREYISVDEESARALIGSQTSTDPIVTDINDHTLTILSAVRDENAVVMEFTLECETGVTALWFDDLSNEAKGAAMSDQATFSFRIDGTGEKIYVDKEKSTQNLLHCYYYGLYVFEKTLADGENPVLNIMYADKPLSDLSEKDTIHEKSIPVPAKVALGKFTYVSETGGSLEISPISLRVDMSKGLGLMENQAYDPVHLEFTDILYSDGSEYIVYDKNDSIDNTAYLCGNQEADILIAFNRLVDPSQIKSVTVNDVVYTLQND